MTKLIKEKNFFQITCEKKSIVDLENGWVQIEWYASTKDKDRWSDIVEPTAFKSALETYMLNPIVLLQHDMEKPVGIVTDATIDSKGLYIKANITEDEDGILSKLKNGVIRSFSIWYRIKDFEDKQVHDEKWDCIWYETIIKDLELLEISLVSIPMNQYALMKSMNDCFEKEEKSDEIVAEETNDGSIVVEVKNDEIEEKNEENIEKTDEKIEECGSELSEENSDEDTQEQVEQEPEEEKEQAGKSSEIEEKSLDWSENEAVEKTDIENSENSDDSENVDEIATDEETNVETNGGTIVEKAVNLKELSKKSMEMFIDWKFESMKKSFEEKIQQKDMEIESLKKNFNRQTEILAKFAECLEEMDQKMKTTIVSWYAYQKADKPRTAYSNIVENLKKL